MLIIKEVEYAVMILDELYHESPLSAAALSTRRNIPSPFIYRVLKKLEARDILEIRRGPKGGYSSQGRLREADPLRCDQRIREHFYRDRMSEIRLRVRPQQRF